MSNTAGIDFEWRWSPTAEERLLAEVGDEPDPVPPAAAAAKPVPAAGEAAPAEADAAPMIADAAPVVDTSAGRYLGRHASVPPAVAKHEPEWPGFRGPHRDGIVHGVRIETDWSKSPPVELWRRAVGPGWSSFAVDGDVFYTQEQLGDEELRLLLRREDRRTGMEAPRRNPVLGSERRRRSTRNADSPRRPRLHLRWDGDPQRARRARRLRRSGRATRPTDTGKEVPYWGFASSPVVVDDVVVIAASGMLAGYDLATGEPRWSGPKKGGGYSLAPRRDHRRRDAGPLARRHRRDQPRSQQRRDPVAARVAGRRHRAARPDRGR